MRRGRQQVPMCVGLSQMAPQSVARGIWWALPTLQNAYAENPKFCMIRFLIQTRAIMAGRFGFEMSKKFLSHVLRDCDRGHEKEVAHIIDEGQNLP